MKNKLKVFILMLAISMSLLICNDNAYAGRNENQNSIENIKTEFATKIPYSKRQLAMKFVLAMLGVATSSVVIYVGLSIYNRFFYGNSKQIVINEDDNELKTATNMKEAINIFLKKTK